jgi:16S rRNA (guanine1516-N2)-methyltransferase
MGKPVQENGQVNLVAVGITDDRTADARWNDVAAQLADELGLPLLRDGKGDGSDEGKYRVVLRVGGERLQIDWFSSSKTRPFHIDFMDIHTLPAAGRGLRQPIARAVGLTGANRDQPIRVFDATAGFGEDGWLLASLGCRVTMCERHGVVALMLADGIRHARALKRDIADRIDVRYGDARTVLAGFQPLPDVIYLDPMFPEGKGTAAKCKTIQILRTLVGDDRDAAGLLEIAKARGCRRIVVKRSMRAKPIAGEPTVVYRGKLVRYDVYLRTGSSRGHGV